MCKDWYGNGIFISCMIVILFLAACDSNNGVDTISERTAAELLSDLANQSGYDDYDSIVSFGEAFVNLYNGAVAEQETVSFENYISNENLLEFTNRMLAAEQKSELKGGIGVIFGSNNEFGRAEFSKLDENLYYLRLPFENQGSGMSCKLLVQSENQSLKIVDWYFGNKDGADTIATGHPSVRKLDNPNLWNEQGWVDRVSAELEKYEAEQIIGADMAILDYASDDIVIFHGYFGLYVFDLNAEQIIRSLDLKPLQCDQTQGDNYCEISVSMDGDTVQLHPLSSENMYIYTVSSDTLQEVPYQPLEHAFELIPTEEVLDSDMGNYSYNAVRFDTNDYGVLHTYDWTLATLSYRRGDRTFSLFRIEENPVIHSQQLFQLFTNCVNASIGGVDNHIGAFLQ